MATTYYVSKTDGSDSYNGLYPAYVSGNDGPWLTLAKPVATISSGDTAYFRSGTWEDERLDISYKGYTSLTTFARYPSDAVGSVVFDGTNLTPQEYEDGVIFVKSTNYVKIDGIKVQNFSKCGICVITSNDSVIINNITETTGSAGIILHYADSCDVQYNKVYYANLHSWGSGMEEEISIASWSTNIDVSYNEVYAGNRNLGWTGGEGINIKAGSTYVYVHDNYVDHARPDEQESDRYCMGVDAWTQETHHIYFYRNITKNGSYGIIFDSEDGGYGHHLYAWNNIFIHCGHCNNQLGAGLGMPLYGVQGVLTECYFWNNTIYDCYNGIKITHQDAYTTAPIIFRNNLIYDCASTVVYWGSGTNQDDFTFDHNLLDTEDPKFVDANNENFRLQSDSPARDAGTTIAFPVGNNEDYDGTARPQGANYDIGAFEYAEQEKILMRHHRLA